MKKLMLGLGLLGLASCGGGTGDLTVTTYGEDYIEKQIPATAFADGWSVKFSKFLVTIGEVKVASHDGKVAAESTGAKVFDVHQPGPVTVESFPGLPAADWDTVSYAIAPSASARAGNASAEDVELMKTSGWSVFVQGVATKGTETKRFEWGFPTNTLYEKCEHPNLGEGVTVPNGGEEMLQFTIHGDHLFFDDLQSPDAKMRFNALAAADQAGIVGADGQITLEELELVDLTQLPPDQYSTGGASKVRNLRDFVTALVRTLGHYRGEGECAPRVR
ncbi:hypothetical protein F0U62_43355 [Cystobacter fuscus]|uniref:hypothetical protein n=1 Tax=Cystobacter fuscus TaxID=43 RepID=UPI002B2C6B60|nr:hypothetical protein F0U62_43355 [Cystobacter fuscus]